MGRRTWRRAAQPRDVRRGHLRPRVGERNIKAHPKVRQFYASLHECDATDAQDKRKRGRTDGVSHPARRQQPHEEGHPSLGGVTASGVAVKPEPGKVRLTFQFLEHGVERDDCFPPASRPTLHLAETVQASALWVTVQHRTLHVPLTSALQVVRPSSD